MRAMRCPISRSRDSDIDAGTRRISLRSLAVYTTWGSRAVPRYREALPGVAGPGGTRCPPSYLAGAERHISFGSQLDGDFDRGTGS